MPNNLDELLGQYGAPPRRAATLAPGPEPTGRDKMFDAIYGWMGGTPDSRSAADNLTTILDWGTLGMLSGAYDGGKELAQTGRPESLAINMMPGARVAKPAVQAAERAVVRGIRGYHGSPHDFAAERLVRYPDGRTEYVVGAPDRLPDIPDGAVSIKDFPLGRFREDKIGTGEGAQAYGRGVAYIAENEGIARHYRDQLSSPQAYIGDRHAGNVGLLSADSHHDPLFLAAFYLQRNRGDTKAAAADFEKYAKMGLYDRVMVSDGKGGFRYDETVPTMTRYWLDRASKDGYRVEAPGHMYEVRINAHPDDFLDWDKPLSQQSEKVRRAVNKFGPDVATGDPLGSDIVGSKIPFELRYTHGIKSGDREPRDMGSLALREAGIPGIRYLDQGSRSAGEGSRNFVVFPAYPDPIEIVRKYGIAGLLAAYYGAAPSEVEAATRLP